MRFVIEIWNATIRRYIKSGEYSTLERAEIMFNKPYYQTATRRLIRIQEEILYSAKAKRKLI